VPRIPKEEFEAVPLRVHAFLAGVPLHDVWATDLPTRAPASRSTSFSASRPGRSSALACRARTVNIRFFFGGLFGWDRTTSATTAFATFTDRLNGRSIGRGCWRRPAGRTGSFGWSTGSKNEQLLELINRTAHAAALTALVETASGLSLLLRGLCPQRRPAHTLYMALIDPFRKLIVYPSLLRNVRARWGQTIGSGENPD